MTSKCQVLRSECQKKVVRGVDAFHMTLSFVNDVRMLKTFHTVDYS